MYDPHMSVVGLSERKVLDSVKILSLMVIGMQRDKNFGGITAFVKPIYCFCLNYVCRFIIF